MRKQGAPGTRSGHLLASLTAFALNYASVESENEGFSEVIDF